ncbi:MAG TPA: flagellar hook-basal body complex protein FliE [Caldilineae bacterium]|nr:flagellar hook-basal body complex protein FliE [Caldilineae bacterium]
MRTNAVLSPSVRGLATQADRARPEAVGGASFGELVRDALEQLNRLQQEADDAATRLALGEPVDLHDVMIAVQKADLGFQLALQVRNKLIEAYQEIMRMQV